MSKLWLIALLPLAACTTKDEADYNRVLALGDMPNGIAITSSIDEHGTAYLEAMIYAGYDGLLDQCFVLPAETTATLDGAPVYMNLGGYHWNTGDWGAHCDPILVAVSGVTHGSALVIGDANTTWTIEAHDLIGNDFVQDPTDPTKFTWNNVTAIDSGWVYRTRIDGTQDARISGNQLDAADSPGAITAIEAVGHTKPTRCEGPSTCSVELTAYHPLSTASK